MGLSTALKTAAVARMARGQAPLVRSSNSFIDRERRWKDVQALIARAVVSDPDIVFYFKAMALNNTLKRLQKVKSLAEEALVTLPGTLMPQRPLNTEQLALLASSGREAQLSVEGGQDPIDHPWFGSQTWDRALAGMGASLNAGGISGPRGEEAVSKTTAAITNLVAAWTDFQESYRATTLTGLGAESLFRTLAVQSSLSKTLQTLEMAPPDNRQTEYINQLAAGLSAVKTMSRDFSFSHRVHIQGGDQRVPQEFEVSPIVQSGNITGFSVRERKTGLGVSPALLNIKVLDQVLINQGSFLGGSKQVASISGSQLLLNSPVPEQAIVSLEIVPLAYIQLNELILRLTDQFFLDPVAQPGARRVNYLTEFSSLVGQINRLSGQQSQVSLLALSLYNLINSIDVPSARAESSLTRLSPLTPASYPVRLATLFAVGNPISSLLASRQIDLVKRARLILRTLKSEGWLRAHRELAEYGSLASVVSMSLQMATFDGVIAELNSDIRSSAEVFNAGVRA